MSLSGYLVNEWGWHAPFWMGGFTALVGIVLSFFIYEPKEGITREPVLVKDLASVIREPILLKVSLLSIIAHSMIFTTMFGFIPSYALSIGLGASHWHAHDGQGICSRFWQMERVDDGIYAERHIYAHYPFVDSKGWMCIVQGFNGFSQGLLFPPLLGMAIETIPHEKRATAMGIYQALYALGMFGGPFLAGVFNSAMGLAAGFYFTDALGLVAAVLIIFWNKKAAQHFV